MSIYKKKEVQILSTGVCECIVAPISDELQEDFIRGDEYYYVKKKDGFGIYYKVFHNTEDAESFGEKTFNKYFKHIRNDIPGNYKNLV